MPSSPLVKLARFVAASVLFATALFSPSYSLAAPGAVVQTTLLRIPGGIDKSYSLTVQPDGKVLAAGYAYLGTKQLAITRYNTNGSVDTTFGDAGTRLEWLGPGDAEAHGIGVQSTGKIVVAGFAVSDQSRFGLARFNSDGSLDTSFGGGGAVTTIGTNAAALAMALQPDDRIVLGGWSTSGGNKVFTLARYDASSPTLDTTFGSGGVVVASPGGVDEQVNALAIQSDGKIVAAGSDANNETLVRRYNADGTLDTTFGNSGTFVTSTMAAHGVAVLTNGDILVGGNLSGTGGTFAVARLTSAGALDTTFGVNGYAQSGTGASNGSGNALQVQSDGRIVVAGTTVPSQSAIAVARFNSDGSNDTSFGNSGVAVHQMTIENDEGDALAILSSGELVVAGAGNRSPSDCACTASSSADGALLVGLNTSGAVDSTYAGGLSVLNRGSKQSGAFASAIQSDGKLVVAGLQHPTPSETDAVINGTTESTLARYNADGSLDTSFGTNGIAAIAGDKLLAVALQSDGKIVAAGYADGNFQGIDATRIMVVRLNANGTLDSTFGSNGVAFVPLDSTMEQAYGIALQSDGKIVVGGIIEPQGTFSDALFARLNPDGSMDTSFGTSGKVRVAMSTGSDQVNAIAIQGDGKIVGAGWGQLSGSQDGFGVVRLNGDGTLDSGFGTGGIVMTAIGTSIAHGNALALQADGRIVVGGQAFGTSTDDFALARYNTDGTLDSSFGSGGTVTTDVGNHNRIFALTILPSGKITAAGEWATSFGIIQYLPSGTVDTSFGSGGSVFLTMNTATNEIAHSIVQRPDGNLWVSGEASGVVGLAVIGGDSGTITKANATVSLASSSNPSNAGQSVTFTATVAGTSGTPTGTVTFLDGANAISGCSANALSSGSATCSTSALSGGSHSITAQYAGDATYNTATSNAVTQVVNSTKATASVSLVSSANPSSAGQGVTFTATLTGGSGMPTGSVTFLDGASAISGCSSVALSGGSAACSTSSLTAGSHSISAQYSGDASYNAASSGAITQTVQSSGSTTSTNVALASSGATATASSTAGSNFPASSLIDGDEAGINWGAGGGWKDATASTWPDWVEVDFGATQTIDHVTVFSLQDNPGSPSQPTDSMTFSSYGVTDFDVQVWNGSAWVTVGSVTGNDLVKRNVAFTAVATDRIRVNINHALASYSRLVEVQAWSVGSAPPAPSTNVALASSGAVASASSTAGSNFPASSLIDGDEAGMNWGAGGGWKDATASTWPDWVEVDFAATQTIDHVTVFSLQDTPGSPSQPTNSMTFSSYGVTDFDVQVWNGSAWVTVGSVTGNDLVKRNVAFTAVATDRIRVSINHALASYSRLVEVEAWTVGATTAPSTNFALASSGAVASASSTAGSNFPASSLIDGDEAGMNWGAGGGWKDATASTWPDWVEVDFAGGAHTIDHVTVFSLQDTPGSPSQPTDSMTFSSYGVTDFDVQAWNGSAWVTVGSVTGNDLVKRNVAFTPVSTDRIRVSINHALASYSRLVEVEAWGS